MESNQLVEEFLRCASLSTVPKADLEWLASKGSLKTFKKGETLFSKGEPADYFYYVLKGRFRLYIEQNGGKREMGLLEHHEITGLLPYSRMTQTTGNAVSMDEAEVFAAHKVCFPEMIREKPSLTEALVHHMASRIRNFTAMRAQNEKLISLGKLSAGLAHELNNPASAMVSSSEALLQNLRLVPDVFKSVMTAKIQPDVVDQLNAWLFDLIDHPKPKLNLSERTKAEDELTDFLDDCNLDDSVELAEVLVDHQVLRGDVEKMHAIGNGESFETTLRWVANNLVTEKLVTDIRESAHRIAELIRSIKEYSHMDRVQDRQPIDINAGIRSTLRMLGHKIKSGKIDVEEHLDERLPLAMGVPGELNQVWTNIMDNAIDAMSSGGTLTIRTAWGEPFITISISDTGDGIPEDIKQQIFDPFFTTKDVGKGTGLGLDIVNKIISNHKGAIEVESKPGATTFEICIPAVDAI